jgi:peptidoglycan/xylan/chitin deacetylase (PgdA/CDA1 family)
MTPDELRAFASEPLVHLGNHTRDHAILTNYTPEAAAAQIGDAQDMLESMCGVRPIMIAYPNGDVTPAVLDAAEKCGLRVGVTVESRRGAVPTDDRERMTIARFSFTRGSDRPSTYLGYRSSVSLRGLARTAAASKR